jgi:nucleoside-diphosphate-sugar epimerase
MNIAVTGASGELGKNLGPCLVEQGHKVRSIDRALPREGGGIPNLRHWVADMRDLGEGVGSLRECDAVIHLAALRSPG